MSTTAEIQRTWALLSLRERLSFVVQTAGVALLNGAIPALLSFGLDVVPREGGWIRFALVLLAFFVAAFLGVLWFFARPGNAAWRESNE